MDNDSQFDENDFSIDIINNCEELEEEKTTSIKSNDNKACDDINKDKKVIKEENIKEKSKIPFQRKKKKKKMNQHRLKKAIQMMMMNTQMKIIMLIQIVL